MTATVYNSNNVSVGSQTVTAVDGVATFSDNLTADVAGSGYTIKVTSSAANPPSSITTGSFSVVPATPTELVFMAAPPGTVTAGNTFGLTVELEDAFGNVATNYTGSVHAALTTNPGGSSLGANDQRQCISNKPATRALRRSRVFR